MKSLIKKILREEVSSLDNKEKVLTKLINMMGPSNIRKGNRIEVVDNDMIGHTTKLTINVDYVNQQTLDKINDFMDNNGWFPTNIKSSGGVNGKYSLKVNDFLRQRNVEIGYESRLNGEMIPNKTKAYHVTPDIFVDNVLDNGLTPKTESKLSDHPERIYLFLNPDNTFKQMVKVLFNSLSDEKKKSIYEYKVLEIDLTQLPNHKFFLDPQSSPTYMSIFTLQPIPKSAIKVIDTVPTNDIKPALSPEEEKEMDDETRKLIQQMTSNSSDTDYDKLSDKLSQLSDDELNISMEDLFGLKESIRRIVREEISGKNRIRLKDLVLDVGWNAIADMVGGFDNLCKLIFNGGSKGFMDLYSNLKVEDGYSELGGYNFKSLTLNGDEIIRINERDNEGMISRDKIWSFLENFGWSYYDIDTYLSRWLNKTYGVKVSKCHAYTTLSPDKPFR